MVVLVGDVQVDLGGLPYAFRWAFVVFMIIFHEFMIMNSPRPCRLNGVQGRADCRPEISFVPHANDGIDTHRPAAGRYSTT